MRRGRALVGFAAALLPGCTFQPGGAFATLEEATLTASWQPGEGRDLGDGGARTDLGYEVRLTRASLEVAHVELLAEEGGEAANFDPSDPPPGYTHCDNGHCHDEDGNLVDYADVEAELASGEGSSTTFVEFHVERELDLLSAEAVALQPEDGPDLGRAEVHRAEAEVTGLRLEGTVSGGPDGGGLGDEKAALAVDVALDVHVEGDLDLPIDRDSDPRLRLAFALALDGGLFDGLEFAALASGGAVAVGDGDPAAEALAAALAEGELTVDVWREP